MNIKEDIIKLPQQIKEQEQKLYKLVRLQLEMKELVDLSVIELEKDIYEEKDLITGKQVYKTVTLREGTLKVALSEDDTMKKSFVELNKAKDTVKEAEIELGFLMNTLSVYKRLVEVKAE